MKNMKIRNTEKNKKFKKNKINLNCILFLIK